MSEFLRKVKHEFNSRETGADPYEEDCVVQETDPEEITFPKHEPASIGKNKACSMSQHTSASVQNQVSQKSPKNPPTQGSLANVAEGTENLLRGAYLRE